MTTPPTLPGLATDDDIVARLGRSLNPVESARVDAMIQDGSAIIRRYCRQDFVFVPGDEIEVIADGGIAKLSMWRPITAINSVIAHAGIMGIPDIPITWYQFDGIDQVTVMNPAYAGIINLPEAWYAETFWWGSTFIINGDHGYPQTPDDVMAVLCTAIVSELSTPTMSATLASESIGAYSYAMRRTSGAGLAAALQDAGMKTVLADYRQMTGTLKARL